MHLGKLLTERPLEERRAILAKILPRNDHISLSVVGHCSCRFQSKLDEPQLHVLQLGVEFRNSCVVNAFDLALLRGARFFSARDAVSTNLQEDLILTAGARRKLKMRGVCPKKPKRGHRRDEAAIDDELLPASDGNSCPHADLRINRELVS
jgi:hypothetical protein